MGFGPVRHGLGGTVSGLHHMQGNNMAIMPGNVTLTGPSPDTGSGYWTTGFGTAPVAQEDVAPVEPVEIPPVEIPKDKKERMKDISDRLKAYAERSQSVAGELCAEAAEFIDTVYDEVSLVSPKDIVTVGLDRSFPYAIVQTQNPSSMMSQVDANNLIVRLMKAGVIHIERYDDPVEGAYKLRVRMQALKAPDLKAAVDIDIPPYQHDPNYCDSARKEIERQMEMVRIAKDNASMLAKMGAKGQSAQYEQEKAIAEMIKSGKL